jgi:transcriptional regulator with XRE-family HTH domain
MPNVDEGAKAWELALAATLGGAVLHYRKELKLTAVQLAARTKKLGFPISRVTITKIEQNMRVGKLGVAELVVLADALEVSPLNLLYPGLADQPCSYLPNQEMPTLAAKNRFVGEATWPVAQISALVTQLDRMERAMISAPLSGHGQLSSSFTGEVKKATVAGEVHEVYEEEI